MSKLADNVSFHQQYSANLIALALVEKADVRIDEKNKGSLTVSKEARMGAYTVKEAHDLAVHTFAQVHQTGNYSEFKGLTKKLEERVIELYAPQITLLTKLLAGEVQPDDVDENGNVALDVALRTLSTMASQAMVLDNQKTVNHLIEIANFNDRNCDEDGRLKNPLALEFLANLYLALERSEEAFTRNKDYLVLPNWDKEQAKDPQIRRELFVQGLDDLKRRILQHDRTTSITEERGASPANLEEAEVVENPAFEEPEVTRSRESSVSRSWDEAIALTPEPDVEVRRKPVTTEPEPAVRPASASAYRLNEHEVNELQRSLGRALHAMDARERANS